MDNDNKNNNEELNDKVNTSIPSDGEVNEMDTNTIDEAQGCDMDTETNDDFEFETDLTEWRNSERRSGGSSLSEDRLLIKSKYEKCPVGAMFRVPVAKLTGEPKKDAEIGAAYRVSIANMLKTQGYDDRAVRLSLDGKELMIGKGIGKTK